MTTYVVLRENFAADRWDHVGCVDALDPERAVRQVLNGSRSTTEPIFGTYVAIPADEFVQFVEGRPRVVISAHIETLEPAEQAHA